MNTGGSTASRNPPRRHALNIPSSVPRTKAMTVAIPTRPRVQSRPCLITSPTGAGKKVSEVPKSPCSVLPRYCRYCDENVLVAVDAECDLEILDRLRADAAVEAHEHRLAWVAGHDPRQDEVDGQRGPERDEEKLQAPDHVTHRS